MSEPLESSPPALLEVSEPELYSMSMSSPIVVFHVLNDRLLIGSSRKSSSELESSPPAPLEVSEPELYSTSMSSPIVVLELKEYNIRLK